MLGPCLEQVIKVRVNRINEVNEVNEVNEINEVNENSKLKSKIYRGAKAICTEGREALSLIES